MKVMTILGTRPEIIRLSRIISLLDQSCEHVLVHTGQNYDKNLSDIFFRELGVRAPDFYLGVQSSSFGKQIGKILIETERILHEVNPDKLLLLGDTNSALSAVVAKRMGIPVYHMEAGNRCYDDRVPEEVNRRIIDHCSDVLMPYTERSRANLIREGIPGNRIFVTGNPIMEVLNHHIPQIESSDIHQRLGILPNQYFLITMHRAENVDDKKRLASFITTFGLLYSIFKIPIIISLHPHTREKMKTGRINFKQEGFIVQEPFGLFDFIKLEKNAFCVISDSGTVQEECCLFKVPNVTIRDVTERPETIECGSNILTGSDPDQIISCVHAVIKTETHWQPPIEYKEEKVSATVTKIVLGYSHKCACQ